MSKKRCVIVAVVATSLACLLSCAAALAGGDANAGSCAAFPGTEASPGFRGYLPDCRAYELVTPPFHGGQPAEGTLGVGNGSFGVAGGGQPIMSADGQHLLALDFAGFAGTENEEQTGSSELGAIYEFSRTPFTRSCVFAALECWSTEALEPPASQYSRRAFVAASADLSRTLWQLVVQAKGGEERVGEELVREKYAFAVREVGPDGRVRFTGVGPVDSPEGKHDPNLVVFQGASRDLTRVLLAVDTRSLGAEEQVGGNLWPGDNTKEGVSLYEYVGTGNREPALVGVTNGTELVSECGTILGAAKEGTTYNAVSASGAIVYFTALHAEACFGRQPAVNELYARIDGTHTVALSEPGSPQCTGECAKATHRSAVFQGASEDGSKVFFMTEQPLLNSDEEGIGTGRDLYEEELEGGAVKRLVQVSHDPVKGQAANVVSAMRASADGSHAYYVAKGVLTGKKNMNGEEAESGAYNLYSYDTTTEHTSFVANLVTRSEIEAIEASEEIKNKTKAIEEESEKLQAKKTETTSKRAECKIEREKGELILAEECEAIAKQDEAVLKEDQSQLVRAERGLTEAFDTRVGSVTHVDEHRPFETTPNGRFLVFATTRHLTGSEDTSTVAQLFEYDAQSESLVRVSTGQKGGYLCPSAGKIEEGYNCNGNTTIGENASMILAREYDGNSTPTCATCALSLSDDGAVVFTSRGALAPGAVVDGRENVYEHRDGNTYLISPADEAAPLETGRSRLLGIDESGGDVFFFTSDNLVPQHTDSQSGWYDARIGGGFPAPVLPATCAGDACHGPLSATPLLPSPGGPSAGGGNLTPPVSHPVPGLTQAQKLARALRACRKKPRRERAACERRAKKSYGHPSKKARTRARRRR